MATSRKRIIDYLRRHQSASAREIGRFLGVTAADARHHLAHLEISGMVEAFTMQHPMGRGRPSKVYRLTRMVLGDNFDVLASALLSAFLKGQVSSEQSNALITLVDQMVAADVAITSFTESAGSAMTHRLSRLVEALNSWHYQSHWEAGVTGPRIILGYCPYAAILGQHPELCMLDAQIIQRCLGISVEQVGRLERNERGMLTCTFSVMVPME